MGNKNMMWVGGAEFPQIMTWMDEGYNILI